MFEYLLFTQPDLVFSASPSFLKFLLHPCLHVQIFKVNLSTFTVSPNPFPLNWFQPLKCPIPHMLKIEEALTVGPVSLLCHGTLIKAGQSPPTQLLQLASAYTTPNCLCCHLSSLACPFQLHRAVYTTNSCLISYNPVAFLFCPLWA